MHLLSLAVAFLSATPLEDARDQLNHGRYAEALDAFAAVDEGEAERRAVALGLSRVRIETGRYDEAAAILDAALKDRPDDPDLLARRGALRMLRGDFAGALQNAEAALAKNADHPAGRWVKADALTELGRIDEATEECRWAVRHYNRTQPTDAESLVALGEGALRYARWKRVSAIFHFVINDLCPDIAKDDPADWRADAMSGSLLLEKYNEAQGLPDLERALAKNAHAAEIHAALAAAAFDDYDLDKAAKRIEAALKTNPSHVAALGLQADLAIVEGDADKAREVLNAALVVNPHDQQTLARLAALDLLAGTVDGNTFEAAMTAIETGDPAGLSGDTAFETTLAGLLRRNPKPGAFLARLGKTLEGRRRYVEAERAYAAAAEVMPELSEPQVALGLLSMRAGDLGRAKEILDAAFKADPFHLRVGNMRKVVGLLAGYETLETPHFTIRFDPEGGRVLAELTAEYLEEAYPKLTSEFGFQPPDKTVVELYHTGHGQSGHQWFSARMVGLPWLQTIGASTGLMIALAAPTTVNEYNWARVVRHEFVHVITLQQTEFRIPHWYTEALAVRSEGYPRPEDWDDLLRRRVPKGELRTLDDLNAAFIRPATSDDWQFAYCQSVLYAEHFDETFGAEIHRKLLDGYARGLSTSQVVAEATGTTAEEFESGYRTRLKRIADDLGPPDEAKPSEEVVEVLRKAGRAVKRKQYDEAIGILEPALDRSAPQPDLLELLGKLKLATGETATATDLFVLGRETFPHERRWLKLHAAALLKAGDSSELKSLLERIANADADEALAAKKLAELAAAANDAAAAKRWCFRALHVTPNDAELHDRLATACETLGETTRAETARRHAALIRATAPTSGDDE